MCFVCDMRRVPDAAKLESSSVSLHVGPVGIGGNMGLAGLADWEFEFGIAPLTEFGELTAALLNTGDIPGDSTTTISVTVGGGAVDGAIEVAGDRDWFRVDLVAGQTYTFRTGNGPAGGMDTILTLRDAAGAQLAFNDDAVGLLSEISFTATSSGTYYLDVGGYGTSIGGYTVSAVTSEPPPPDSVPGDVTSTASIGIGGSVAGTIEASGDQDWYRVDLVAGQTYRFSTSGAASGTTISNADLVLRDASGTQVDIDTTGNTASILFTATTSGTYFVDVRGSGSATGGYTLSAATDVPLALATPDQIARHLTHDFWGGSSHRFNVGPGGTLTVNLTGLTAEGAFLAREALGLWSDVTGILFSEVATDGQIVFDDNQQGAYASASYSGGITSNASINIGTEWVTRYGTGLNTYSFQTYVHEIGHVLGLGHGGYYNGAADWDNDARFLNDAWASTVMSYFDNRENGFFNGLGFTRFFAVTPMLADGVAMTSLYGTAASTRTGNTTYGFNNNSGRAVYDAAQHPNVSYTIFDHGGIDTLDYSGFGSNQSIDLRAEFFSNVGSGIGNVMIARGAIIENAIGGSGNDTLTGNSANNVLIGNAGIDVAVFSSARSAYALSFMAPDSFAVRGPDGSDLTIGVERFRFADSVVTVPLTLMEQTLRSVSNEFGAGATAGGWTSFGDFPRVVADINGDGRADIVGFGIAGTYVALGQAGGTFASMVQVNGEFGQGPAAGSWTNNDRSPRMLADVNGDGRADIVGFGEAGTYVALANGQGGFGGTFLATNGFGASASAGGWESQNLYHRTFGDVNGDGRDDIVGFGINGTYVALANANGTFGELQLASNAFGAAPAAGSWSSHNQFPRMLADVNGDGRADVVGFGNAGTYVAYGQSNGTFGAMGVLLDGQFGAAPSAGGWESQDQYARMAVDVNGDNLADIIGFGEAGFYYALNNGAGGFGAFTLGIGAFGAGAAAGGWTSNNLYSRTLADVNGDGLADIIGFGDSGVFVTLASSFTSSPLAETQAEGSTSSADTSTSSAPDDGGSGLAQAVIAAFEDENSVLNESGFMFLPHQPELWPLDTAHIV